jgi:hypothetical protein
MTTLTIRLPDDTSLRLKQLAASRGMSLNKLIEELSTAALAAHDAWPRVPIAGRPWIFWRGSTNSTAARGRIAAAQMLPPSACDIAWRRTGRRAGAVGAPLRMTVWRVRPD